MEQRLWKACQQSFSTESPLSLETLASTRSLIVNPHTSDSTVSSILQTLTRSLQLSGAGPNIQHHILKLLADIASHRSHLSPLVFESIRSNSLLATEPGVAVESLTALASISEGHRNLRNELDDQSFLSLCFGPSVSVRLRLLRKAERLGIQPHVMLSVFLGFTKDPYPYVRKVALDGLAGLCKGGAFEDRSLVEGCYYRAVELLQDAEYCVRSAAVRVVSEWGQILVAVSQDKDRRNWSDVVFVQLCSMVRDMSVEVRIGAFNALGKMQTVSEEILLQTLSKKVLSIIKDKKSTCQYNAENAAGAFVHGLEDEFCEVRTSACFSLRMLVILSSEFAGRALNLLMDILNDDSTIVRLEALETLHHMANFECLKVQEIHMHLFLGTLLDSNDQMRCAARRIIKLLKLPNLDLFRLSIDGLLGNLERHPQDEAEVFCVLFYVGRNHGNFVVHFIQEVSQEMEPVGEGRLSLDSARVAAFLVLSIAAPLSQDQNGLSIPPQLFSYAVTFLARISCALRDLVDQNMLLEYLARCSRSSNEGDKLLLPGVNNDVPRDANIIASMPLLQKGNRYSEGQFLRACESRDVTTSVECQLEEQDEVRKSINLVLAKVKDIWLLVQLRSTPDALRALRACRKELTWFTLASCESTGPLAFALLYLKVIKLLARTWELIMWKVQSWESGELEILLGKLDSRLREMRCRFIGISIEAELHIFELTLVACILRMSNSEICCYRTTFDRLSATLSRLEFLNQEGSFKPSTFIIEVKKALHEIDSSVEDNPCRPSRFVNLVKHFSPKQLSLCSTISHIKAELTVPGNDSENPLSFVPGLPVGIPLDIALHGVLGENRLWVRITRSENSTQFVSLDTNLCNGSNEVSRLTFTAPFYGTPKASSFTLRVCIGMECLFEDFHLTKGFAGPKHVLVYLCQEKEVHLRMV